METLGEQVDKHGICEAFSVLVDLIMSLKLHPIKDKIVYIRIDDQWEVWMNGHMTEEELKPGVKIMPASAYIEFDGWPVAMMNPASGEIISSISVNENAFIAAVKKRIEADKQ